MKHDHAQTQEESPELHSSADASQHELDNDIRQSAKAQIRLIDILVNAVVSSFRESSNLDGKDGN